MNFNEALNIVLRYASVDDDTPESLVDKVVARQSGFTPTATHPSPSVQLTSDELDHWDDKLSKHSDDGSLQADDLHDWGAVLAGRKPAAYLQGVDSLDGHPVGQELLRRSQQMGHQVNYLKGGGLVVGNPVNVQRFQNAHSNYDPQEIGRALGYPEEAVQQFGKVGYTGNVPSGPPKDVNVVNYAPGMKPPTQAPTIKNYKSGMQPPAAPKPPQTGAKPSA